MLEMSSAFYNCVFKIVKSLWRITLQNRNVDTTLKGRRCWKLTDAVKNIGHIFYIAGEQVTCFLISVLFQFHFFMC